MAKKRVKRKVSRKSSSYKSSRRRTNTGKVSSNRKISLVLKNLGMFVIIFIASLGLYYISNNSLWRSFFSMASIVTGFVAVALLISYLVMIFLKVLKKR